MFYEVIDGEGYLNGALKKRHIDQNLAQTYGEELERMSPELVLLTKSGCGSLRTKPGLAQAATGNVL